MKTLDSDRKIDLSMYANICKEVNICKGNKPVEGKE